MEDHIPIRSDRSLLLGRQTSTWSLWDVVFHENNFFQLKDSQLKCWQLVDFYEMKNVARSKENALCSYQTFLKQNTKTL